MIIMFSHNVDLDLGQDVFRVLWAGCLLFAIVSSCMCKSAWPVL